MRASRGWGLPVRTRDLTWASYTMTARQAFVADPRAGRIEAVCQGSLVPPKLLHHLAVGGDHEVLVELALDPGAAGQAHGRP